MIDRVLGEGGMGVVVAAHHVDLNERVALKFLQPQLAENPEVCARFLREAQAAVRIKSEHVARVVDVARLPTGAPYIVMEYLVGSDLGDLLARRGRIPVEQAVDYLLQACDAVAEAHSLGIVHRDLKSSNLFVTERRDGSALVKVLDFGLSKSLVPESARQDLTASTTVLGSPGYMSPEQIRNARTVDERADVWALGVVLYELLTGRLPFESPTVSGLLAAIVADPHTPLRESLPDAPDGLPEVLDACLQKDLARRYRTVAELARALSRFAPTSSMRLVERIGRMLEAELPVDDTAPGDPADFPVPPRAGIRVRSNDERRETALGMGDVTTREAPTLDAKVEHTRPSGGAAQPPTSGITTGAGIADPAPAPSVPWADAPHAAPEPKRGKWWLAAGGVAALTIASVLVVAGTRRDPGASPTAATPVSSAPSAASAPAFAASAAPPEPGGPVVTPVAARAHEIASAAPAASLPPSSPPSRAASVAGKSAVGRAPVASPQAAPPAAPAPPHPAADPLKTSTDSRR